MRTIYMEQGTNETESASQHVLDDFLSQYA